MKIVTECAYISVTRHWKFKNINIVYMAFMLMVSSSSSFTLWSTSSANRRCEMPPTSSEDLGKTCELLCPTMSILTTTTHDTS